MNDDKQIIHHLWWLNKFLNRAFEGKEYAELINQPLNEDITSEADKLVAYIKENY